MADKKLAGKRVLFVIAPEQFRDEELLEPRQILTDAGAQATIASTEPRESTGMLGVKVHPDATIDGVRASDYQAVIVVGGMGSPTHLWENSRLHGILKECQAQ